jgi:hypothetical protein
MLLFLKKVCEVVEMLFFHLCNLALVNAHILCQKGIRQKTRLYKFLEKMAEGPVSNVGMEVVKQPWESSVGQFLSRDHFAFRIPAVLSKIKKNPTYL